MNLLTLFVVFLLVLEIVLWVNRVIRAFWIAVAGWKVSEVKFLGHAYSVYTITGCVWFLICRWMNLF